LAPGAVRQALLAISQALVGVAEGEAAEEEESTTGLVTVQPPAFFG